MKKALICVFLTFALFLLSCSEKEPDVTPSEEVFSPIVPDDAPEEIVPPTEQPPAPEDETLTETSSLTGLPITPEEKALRPVALVLNNLKAALPQCGIGEADVVWEFNMEGGITRLVALYPDISSVGELGAVRSARDYFLDLAAIHGAILVHAGGSPSFYSEVKARDIDNIDEVNMHTIPSDTFWRDSTKRYERGYEHCLETNGEKLVTAILSQNYTTEALSTPSPFNFYTEPTVPEGEDATYISLPFSAYITTEFTYDGETGLYYKKSYGENHIDETTGNTLAFKNLLVLYASHRVVDEDLRLDIDLVGEGRGLLVTAGKAIDINWSRSDNKAPLTLTGENGEVLMFNTGKTHVSVFDKNAESGVTIQ